MAQKKKKVPKEQEDQSTLKLSGIYRRKCDQNGIPQHKIFKQKLQLAIQDGKMETLQMWEEMGPVNVRAIMDSFSQISYKHLKKIRLWKIRAEDQGLRTICNYIDKVQTIQYLDLLDNQITPLGCQFLGKSLMSNNIPLLKLKLDHNCFGAEGLKNLAVGLSKNNVLEKLSVKYCKIDESGAKYIQQMLANINSKLKSLKLQGNPLKNQGAFQILRAVETSQMLQKLNLADVQMTLLSEQQNSSDVKVRDKLVEVLQKNLIVYKYDIRFNQIGDKAAYNIMKAVELNTNIREIELGDMILQQIKQKLNEALKKRKGKKKGKKGGKKGSKTKKKK